MEKDYPIDELRGIYGHQLLSTLDLSKIKTKTSPTTVIVEALLSKTLKKKKITISEVCRHRSNRESKARFSLLFLANLAFAVSLCGADVSLATVALSNQLLCAGIASLQEVEVFGLAVLQEQERGGANIRFTHPIIQFYLSALHLLLEPVMSVMKFVTNRMFSLDKDKWKILEMFFGLAMTDISPFARDCLFYILSFISQAFNATQPYIDNSTKYVLLMKRCLYETQDDSLCIQVHYELLRSHIFCYDLPTINENVSSIAYYMVVQEDASWNIYCKSQRLIDQLVASLEQWKNIKKKKTKCYNIKEIQSLGLDFDNPGIIVISLRSHEYTQTMLKEIFELSAPGGLNTRTVQLEGPRSMEPSVTVSSGTVTEKTSVTRKSMDQTFLSLLPYGSFSREQYEKRKRQLVVIYYNMIKDLVIPHMQVYCTVLINAQYRKDDHIWFKFTRNMRHDFYEAVVINPLVPLHWIKIQEPNGSRELEDKFKSISIQRYQSPTAASTPGDTAELVLLNSALFIRFMITPPTGEDPVVINVFANSDDCSEYGYIGCDCDEFPASHDTKWRGMKPFEDIKTDILIPVQLPLPRNRDQGSGEMTAAGSHSETKKPPALAKPAASTETHPLLPKPHVTPEHQIKRHALEGYDIPGYCFYGDGKIFVVGTTYTIPTKLPRTRVLREGGNGLILEVNFEGVTYAVKQTAFRWREVLIMPKLNHPNILPLLALLMGPPIESFPRRRNIFHFYPRMTNDLGRNVGSYERFCLRSLRERYKEEFLLLKKIDDNFKFLFLSVLRALHYLHTLPNPIVHRDIKPSNILLKTFCPCPNVLTCVCRNRPQIVLSDFDASLELSTEGYLLPDPPKSTSKDFYVTTDRTYHISSVGTIGFKSPEGSMYSISNSSDLMTEMTTKADIFSFGLLSLLVLLNEEGPKYLNQVGTLLFSVHQSSSTFQPLDQAKRTMLQRNGVIEYRANEPCVKDTDIEKILPFKRLRKSFDDIPQLIDFVQKSLVLVPADRASARDLLNHKYLE